MNAARPSHLSSLTSLCLRWLGRPSEHLPEPLPMPDPDTLVAQFQTAQRNNIASQPLLNLALVRATRHLRGALDKSADRDARLSDLDQADALMEFTKEALDLLAPPPAIVDKK